MVEELEVLKTVIERLNKANIPYMITGSMATNYYSVPRMTRDIDIVVELEGENIGKLYNLFKDDFYIDEEMIKDAVRREDTFNVIHNDTIVKVDFIIRKKSEYRELEFSRQREANIEGVSMRIAAPEDMILSKLYWAKDSRSEMQLKDVRTMLDHVEELDTEYIKKWIEKLGLQEIYGEVKK